MPAPHRGICTGDRHHEITVPYGRKLIRDCPFAPCGQPIEWQDKAAKQIIEDGIIPKEEFYEQDV